MDDGQAKKFFKAHAPRDVRDAIAWLLRNGYTLTAQFGESTFGAQFVYSAETDVVLTVDRSQWMLDIAPSRGAKAVQYDLLLAAEAGKSYGEVFPTVGPASVGGELPDQLPHGVSWVATLPNVLLWVSTAFDQEAVGAANRERSALMWPRD